MSAPAMTASSPFSLAPEPALDVPTSGHASPPSPAASPFAPAPAFQPAAALPAFPSMFSGPVVQSVPGVGSSSQDSSFLSAIPLAPQATTSPFTQTPTAPSPFAPDPGLTTDPPATPPASWGSIFPFQSPPDSAPASLPGVGATLFAASQSPQTAGPSESPAPVEAAPPAAAAFFNSFGTAATPAPSAAVAGFDEPAASADLVQGSNAVTFPAAPPKPFNPFERIQALAKAAENSTPPAADPFSKKPDLDTASLFGGSPLPPASEAAARSSRAVSDGAAGSSGQPRRRGGQTEPRCITQELRRTRPRHQSGKHPLLGSIHAALRHGGRPAFDRPCGRAAGCHRRRSGHAHPLAIHPGAQRSAGRTAVERGLERRLRDGSRRRAAARARNAGARCSSSSSACRAARSLLASSRKLVGGEGGGIPHLAAAVLDQHRIDARSAGAGIIGLSAGTGNEAACHASRRRAEPSTPSIGTTRKGRVGDHPGESPDWRAGILSPPRRCRRRRDRYRGRRHPAQRQRHPAPPSDRAARIARRDGCREDRGTHPPASRRRRRALREERPFDRRGRRRFAGRPALPARRPLEDQRPLPRWPASRASTTPRRCTSRAARSRPPSACRARSPSPCCTIRARASPR